MSPDYIISTGNYPGARLACPGHFGGLPFDTIEAAEQEALRLKPGARIAREHIQVRKGKRR